MHLDVIDGVRAHAAPSELDAVVAALDEVAAHVRTLWGRCLQDADEEQVVRLADANRAICAAIRILRAEALGRPADGG